MIEEFKEVTEIQFLIDLLLTYPKIPEAIKTKLIARIGYAELHINKAVVLGNQPQIYIPPTQAPVRAGRNQQSASTQRILDEMAAEGKPVGSNPAQEMAPQSQNVSAPEPAPVPISQVAQTAAAAQALAARSQAIGIAISGKEEKGRTSPRKF